MDHKPPKIHDASVHFTKADIIVPRKHADIFVIAMPLPGHPNRETLAGAAITETGDLVGSAVGTKAEIRRALLHRSSSKFLRYWKACPFGFALHDCIDVSAEELVGWKELQNAISQYRAKSDLHVSDHWEDREPGR